MEIKNIIKKDLNDPNALASVGHLSHQGKQRKVEPLKQSEKPHPNKIDNLRRYANLRTIGLIAIGILAIYAALSTSSKNISPDTVIKLSNDRLTTTNNSVNNNDSEYPIPNVLNDLSEKKSMPPNASKRDHETCEKRSVIDQLIPDYREYLIVFANGSRYEGQLKDGIPWGQGKITYTPNHPFTFRTYEGQWENGEPNGEGLFKYKNNNEYYGPVKNGIPQEGEEGQYTYYNSAHNYKHYKGQVSGAILMRPHGKGTMIYTPRSEYHLYEGQWTDGYRIGNGKLTYADGRLFEGHFENGLPKEGRITYKNGDWFQGNFQGVDGYGEPNHGDGKKTYEDGSVFEGRFAAGFPGGEGTYIRNGDIYKGYFITYEYGLDIFKNGTLQFSNGNYYQGNFMKLRPTNGVMTFKDKSVYEGGFKEDLPEYQWKLIEKIKNGVNDQDGFRGFINALVNRTLFI